MFRFQITPCLGRSYNSSAGSRILNHSSSDQRSRFCVLRGKSFLDTLELSSIDSNCGEKSGEALLLLRQDSGNAGRCFERVNPCLSQSKHRDVSPC